MKRLIVATFAMWAVWASAQEVSLDHTLTAAGVTLFRSRTDAHAWYYLPDEPRIAERRNGEPEFSLVKYTSPAEAVGGGTDGITAARGGGVFHLLARYGVTDQRLAAALVVLREYDERKEDRIVGPIQYRSGTFALISSVADPSGGMARRVSGTGKAPLLEGGKAAVSVALTPQGSSFLWKSFDMATPDVSLAFSLEMEGYRTPYEAELVVDWDRVFSHEALDVQAKIYIIGAEVEMVVDDLFTTGAVRVDVKGESANLDSILESAHARITDLLFDPSPPPEAEAEHRDGGDMGNIVDRVLGSSGRSSRINLFAGYELTKKRRSGKGRISIRQQRAERLFILLTGNIGPIAEDWGDNPRFFKAINLEDPAFRQREVVFSFDGDAGDFAQVVNHLVIQVKKEHGDGTVTMREAALDPARLQRDGNSVIFAYPNAGDSDLDAWLDYGWRAVWSFRGARSHDTGWQDADAFAIALRPPYQIQTVFFDGEPELLQKAGVRSVLAIVEWDFLGESRSERLTFRKGRWSEEINLVLPAARPVFGVTLEWHLTDGNKARRGPWDESSGVVFIDEVPEPNDRTQGGHS
ncbi:MAG: hypothetical protein GY906_39470 [bacterium]|nr:hypothetical protein [bacterium]